MECTCFNSKEDLENKEYSEMQKIIKKDFQRLIYIFENYENNKELIDEFKNVIENICNNETISLGVNVGIDLMPNYLCFDYIDQNGFKTCEDFDFISVIISRNTKNFYFVYRFNPSIGTIIKEFNIKDKKVIYNEYKDKFASPIFDDKGFISSDVSRLKYLPRLN